MHVLKIMSVFLVGLSIVGCKSQAQQPPQPVTTTVVVTPVPIAKEIVMVPIGYTTCFTAPGAFYQTIWVPAHRVCQYETASSKKTWVDGYWACTNYDISSNSKCHHWLWKRAHWVSGTAVY